MPEHNPRGNACTYWCTGLSGAGKTTLAQALAQQLRAWGQPVCVLDGDELRAGLCSDLGFSPAEREENMRRTSQLARLLNSQGIVVVVALISPTVSGRSAARLTIGDEHFIEVHVSTSLEICQQRDSKGLYARAQQDCSMSLTGVSAPYEAPLQPDHRIDTSRLNLQQAVQQILEPHRHHD